MNSLIKSLLVGSIGILMFSGITTAQVKKDSKLFKTLKEKDSIVFKIGFNKCEVMKAAAILADDLEFYHDISGVSKSKAEFIAIMENGLCHKDRRDQTYRFLVGNSLEVFPLYDDGELYGALQNGKHFFSNDKNMSYENSNNYALFSHLWIIEKNEWKLKRVISYNHRSQ